MQSEESHIDLQLGVLTLARLFINTGLRMVYPFAPALARGLGVPISAIYSLIVVRNFTGFLSPLFGPLSDRYGRRPVMIGGLLTMGAGALLLIVWGGFLALGAALALIALAKVIYDPAMQADVGDTVPYAKRGRALSFTELSWSGALLIGAPVMGLLMQQGGWTTPFYLLLLLAILGAFLLRLFVSRANGPPAETAGLGEAWRALGRYPVIWAGAAFLGLALAANDTFFVVFGAWMESSFQLGLASLGLTAAVIGGAELTGEIASGLSVDRFGKRRVVITTGLLNALLYLAIPFFGREMGGALVSLFVLFLFFEITVVGSFPLLTEIVPGSRGLVMSFVVAAGALGRTVGSLLGPFLWSRGGFVLNATVAALIMGCAIFILARWVHEPRAEVAAPVSEVL